MYSSILDFPFRSFAFYLWTINDTKLLKAFGATFGSAVTRLDIYAEYPVVLNLSDIQMLLIVG